MDSFEFGPLPELESLDEVSISTQAPSLAPEEDIWQIAVDLGPAKEGILFHTWEAFENKDHVECRTPYVTEHGPGAFDAALASDTGNTSTGRVIRGDVLLQSLWNLGLGRSSILFQFNSKLKTFQPAIVDGRASGLSLRAAQSLITQFIHTGNLFLYLRSFAERAFALATNIPAKVALATSTSSILTTLEDHLGKHSKGIASLLQLQRLFARPREILVHVARMVDSVKHAKTNEQLSSILHHRMLETEEGDHYLRKLSCQVLCQVAGPSLELLCEWMGIQQEQATAPVSSRGSFVAVEEGSPDQGPLEYVYRSEMMPRFITPEDGNTIFETGSSLRFLKTQHPYHPLANLEKVGVQPPRLEWSFGWKEIDAIATKAKDYEDQLRKAILAYSHGSSTPAPMSATPSAVEPTSREERVQGLEQYFEESLRELDAPPKRLFSLIPDELKLVMDQILDGSETKDSCPSDEFSPPLSITSTLSFRPLITAQAKLVNAATLRLFFRSHQMRLHLSLQRQYHLFGDGVFSSLLATALFDPERESAERHKGKMRSGVHMGLQLGSRKTWPPASSELRLALRGVLSESYYSSALYQSTSGVRDVHVTSMTIAGRDNDELPGQLNFAIRNLSEAEQEKVMDPDALWALDFLRLQYVPPTPLNLVITSAALDKYDVLFKFLLRLLRMLFVVSHLPRAFPDVESRRFRGEAHHFVMVLANYVFQTGIAEHWNGFEAFVHRLETRLDEEDAAGEAGTRVTEGIASLREAHEQCLDSILFSLLLRKRQRKIMCLVEEAFDYILLFAKMQRQDAQVQESVAGLYAKLKGKIRVFLSVCRGLTGKKGYGKGKGTVEENSIERLVVGMEMNGYFATS